MGEDEEAMDRRARTDNWISAFKGEAEADLKIRGEGVGGQEKLWLYDIARHLGGSISTLGHDVLNMPLGFS